MSHAALFFQSCRCNECHLVRVAMFCAREARIHAIERVMATTPPAPVMPRLPRKLRAVAR
jgi:hypothetical protein